MVIILQDDVQKTLKAVSDPTRREILRLLAEAPRTVSELVSEFSISQPAVTKQLDVLERAGLVKRQREGPVSRCLIRVRALDAALGWIHALKETLDERIYRLE